MLVVLITRVAFIALTACLIYILILRTYIAGMSNQKWLILGNYNHNDENGYSFHKSYNTAAMQDYAYELPPSPELDSNPLRPILYITLSPC
jgi:hypothetical protein